MTGVVAATLGTQPSFRGLIGGGNVTGALAWNDIYGEDSGATQTLAVTGISHPIQVAATSTGSGLLSYLLNGVFAPYAGAFTVAPNDMLAWAISITGSADRSGIVTVTNASASTTISSFNYTVYSSRGGRM